MEVDGLLQTVTRYRWHVCGPGVGRAGRDVIATEETSRCVRINIADSKSRMKLHGTSLINAAKISELE